MVCAEVEFRGRTDHAVAGAAVRLAGGDGEVAGQYGPGQRHHDEVADSEVRCSADDVTWLRLTDVDLDRADGLLELGQLLDLRNPADGQRTADGAHRDDLFDLMADPDQGLLEFLG